MQREIKQELVSFWIVFLQQIGMPKWIIRRAMGLTPLAMHILTEREKMHRNLWLQVMFDDNWTCQNCHIRNFKNQEMGKPKMQADHVRALFNYGTTVRSNLQVLCEPCNKRKGTKNLDNRVLYPAMNKVKNIIVVLLLILSALSWIIWRMLVH